MGIYDRDYMRERPRPEFPVKIVIGGAIFAAFLLVLIVSQCHPQRGQAGRDPAKGSLRVNLNTATQAELCSLPQVGPARAHAIIASRPYGTIDDLATKKVVGSKLLQSIRPYLKTDGVTEQF